MEGAGKKWNRVVLTVKAKIDIYNRPECGENHNKLKSMVMDLQSSMIYKSRNMSC
jgi:hypothetical protein